MKFTPENITKLEENQVFCYGANEVGKHGLGAAKLALKWGAKYGEYGFNGQTYGIPTKNKNIETLPLDKIEEHIYDFLLFAKTRPDLEFLVTKIGTGLAGISIEDMKSLFQKYYIPSNVILPEEFSV